MSDFLTYSMGGESVLSRTSADPAGGGFGDFLRGLGDIGLGLGTSLSRSYATSFAREQGAPAANYVLGPAPVADPYQSLKSYLVVGALLVAGGLVVYAVVKRL